MKKTKWTMAWAASFALAFTGAAVAGNAPAAENMAQGSNMPMQAMNWFGGPIYTGAPALGATAALVKAGGGAENFKFSTALVSMLGQKTVQAEVAKLNKQYGEEAVNNFLHGMTFAIKDGLKRATEAGVTLPAAPAGLKGAKLAKALVGAGTAPDGTFWSGYLFDHAISHKLHNLVMADIDAKFGHGADQNTHKILNQAMYDVAQALGEHKVKLASLH
ncbi:MAG TPA: hypothetical protein VFK31_05575 [Rhodanobacteraceae bacterium]|nr:hypothetical protein [Rhodanobacteraceae bacterium]